MQVRFRITTGDPQPGNCKDCTVSRDFGIKDKMADRLVMANDGYQCNP